MKTLTKQIETRAMPKLEEQRNLLLEKMEELTTLARQENRSFKQDEIKKFEEYRTEINDIDRQLQAQNHGFGIMVPVRGTGADLETRAKQDKEERAFLDYIVKGDMRSLSASGSGGAVIPTSIASRIVDKMVQMSPLLQRATIFRTNADLSVPVFDFTQIITGYILEGNAISDTSQEFAQVKLTNYIAAALVKVSRSLVNRSDIDVLNYLVTAIAKSLGYFLERQLILGTGTASIRGLATVPTAQRYTGATTGAISGDEVIEMQLRLAQAYQDNAIWVMNPESLADIRKLKTANGDYLFSVGQFGSDMGMTLLGKPVFLSDAVPVNGPGALAIHYLDPQCLYIKMTTDVGIQLLDQAYASSYQYGLLGFVELDSAIAEVQGIVTYVGA